MSVPDSRSFTTAAGSGDSSPSGGACASGPAAVAASGSPARTSSTRDLFDSMRETRSV
ncbi:hypothetical protein MBEHAL_1383 [Halarchaeum acidiphilum MH1-52-1]|uniref:Uncharacterized protein n=1 Tax=Halarchaeum acidiphilum MH1-52-1 TaxID=1261545 RepID=U3ACX3_9EURY|nr:hypothetical protein MBEHAL_1383 [Halarchaeum acidiphilum MH1-52-1]